MPRPLLEQTVRTLCMFVALVLTAVWLTEPVPLAARALQVSLLALGIVRPQDALLLLAGLGPLAWELTNLVPLQIPGGQLLQELVVAVVAGVLIRWPVNERPSRTAVPALMVALVGLVSAWAMTPSRIPPSVPPDANSWQYVVILLRDAFGVTSQPAGAALVVAEGAALTWAAECLVRKDRSLALRMIVLSGLSLSGTALLNITRVVSAAFRSGEFLKSLLPLLATTRYNIFYDRNAAASLFVLVLFAGVAVSRASMRRTVLLAPLLAAILIGVWLCGSRIALLAIVLVAAGAAAATWAPLRRRREWLVGSLVTAVISACVLYVVAYPSGRNDIVASSLAGRMSMWGVALRIARSAPVFGVGVGMFPEHAVEFGSSIGPENAHNNAVQVLAEEGIVGLVSLTALLGLALWPGRRAEKTEPDPVRFWLMAGLIGFLITMITGHPLLVPEVALPFWMFVGAAAGLNAAPGGLAWRSVGIALVAAAIVVISLPVRAAEIRAKASYEYLGVNVSQWRTDPSGIKYREGAAAFTLFLRSDQVAMMPIRRAPNVNRSLRVDVRLSGRSLSSLTLSSDEWSSLELHIPATGRLFERVDFFVSAADDGATSLPTPCVFIAGR